MKSKIVVITLVLFAACSNSRNDRKNSVKGVYVASYQNESSRGMDTIEIVPLNESPNTFHYIRRVGYNRISNGNAGPYKLERDTSTCIYDESAAQLNEQSYGRIYSISEDGNSLVSGGTIYKRIQ